MVSVISPGLRLGWGGGWFGGEAFEAGYRWDRGVKLENL